MSRFRRHRADVSGESGPIDVLQRESTALRRWLIVAGCLAVLLLAGISTFLAWQQYDDAKERARNEADTGRSSVQEGRGSPALIAATPATKSRKLSNKERAELATLPAKIQALEAEQSKLTDTLADPAFFRNAGADVAKATTRLQAIESELPMVYARWEELEAANR